MGAGAACEIDVEGIGLLRAGSANIIVIVAIAAAGVVAVLAIIVVVILICKKRRPKDQCESKNNNPLTLYSYRGYAHAPGRQSIQKRARRPHLPLPL